MRTASPSAGCRCSPAWSPRLNPASAAPAALQQPVVIAGVVVLPGDIDADADADADGVVVVQRAEAERVVADETTEAEKRIAYTAGMRR